MLNFLLLTEEADPNAGTNDWVQWVIFIVLIALLVVWFVWSSKRNKKKQQEAEDLVNSVQPGNKVKTIGGICGIVVEVNKEEGTFVLETGSETTGKYYLKFDKQAIYQTDAVADKSKKSDKSAEAKEQPAEEKVEEVAEEKAEETKTEE